MFPSHFPTRSNFQPQLPPHLHTPSLPTPTNPTPKMSPQYSLTAPKLLTLLLTITLSTATQARTCGPGTYRSTPTTCAPCPAGTYQWLPNQRSCTPCPKNTHAAYEGTVDRALCLPCASNAFAPAASASCKSCPGNKIRKSDSNACRPCRGSECRACPRGTERTPTGECEHIACPRGYTRPPVSMSYYGRDVCISTTTGCPQGAKFSSWVRQPICKRAGKVVCQAGSRFDGKDRCLSCSTGSKMVYNRAERRLQCHDCVGHSVSRGGLSKTCTPCRRGFVSSLDGARCVRLNV